MGVFQARKTKPNPPLALLLDGDNCQDNHPLSQQASSKQRLNSSELTGLPYGAQHVTSKIPTLLLHSLRQGGIEAPLVSRWCFPPGKPALHVMLLLSSLC